MEIRVCSFDYDGCIRPRPSYLDTYDTSVSASIVAHNLVLLDPLKKEAHRYFKTIVCVGSSRQSYKIDTQKGVEDSCFPAFGKVSKYLGASFDCFLLADVYGNLKDGESYAKIIKPSPATPHSDWVFDRTKATVLYAQMQRIASKNPKKLIDFLFYDDQDKILAALYGFFSSYPHLIPRNVTLNLFFYNGVRCNLVQNSIQGSGPIDSNYRQTVKHMATVARAKQRQRGGGDPLSSTEFLNPTYPKDIDAAQYVYPFHLSRGNFIMQLDAIRVKGEQLIAKGHVKAGQTARNLVSTLEREAERFFKRESSTVEFKSIYETEISKARVELEKHRGWKRVLGNLAIALGTLVVGFIVAGSIHKATTGRFLFFNNTRSKLMLDTLDSVTETLVQLPEIRSPLTTSFALRPIFRRPLRSNDTLSSSDSALAKS